MRPSGMRPLLAGAALLALCLVVVVLAPGAGLRGWLAAAFFWASLPMGAVALLMMVRLIPGIWAAELSGSLEALALLMPLGAAAMLPVLIGAGALYPWAGASRYVYLTPWFFGLRALGILAVMLALAALLVLWRRAAVAVAVLGLIGYTLLGSVAAVDWLLSLDPEFHSSGFGLYAISIQMNIALMVAVALAALADPSPARPEVLGGLMIAAILIWAYLAFMQYFITWSDNLPAGVTWYQRRGVGVWSAVEYAIGVLNLGPLALLIAPLIRRSRSALTALAVVVLAGKALECAWLVLPGGGGGWAAALVTVLALTGLGVLAWGWLGVVKRFAAADPERGVVPA